MFSDVPRILTPSLAPACGMSRSRVRTEIRRGRWQVLAPGVVLTHAGEPSRLDWAAAGIECGGPSAALSGWDACRALGVGDRRPPPSPVLVLRRDGRSRRMGGVLIRTTERRYAAKELFGQADLPFAPVVPLARAVADAALMMRRLDGVRALVAGAVQSGRCTLDQLGYELDAGPQQGSAFLRATLDEVGAGVRSAAEARAVSLLKKARLPSFELNAPIVDDSGTVLYIVDVLWRELRAALEIDSVEYHFAVREWQATMDRHNQLARMGLAVTHYPPSAIMTSGDAWIAQVEQWLRARARELHLPHRTGGVRPAAPYLVTSSTAATG